MRKFVFLLLLLAPTLPGCAVAAIAAVSGAVVVSSVSKNATTSIIERRTSIVWASVKSTLAEMSDQPVATLEDEMQATATIDNHTVVVTVKAFDLEKSQVFIDATEFGLPSSAMAQEVMGRISRDTSQL
jgi:hypothetical protein